MLAHHAHACGILRLGVVLFLLGLLTGVAIPAFSVPRLGLSAHISGVLGGLVLIVIGLVWPQLRISSRASRTGFGLAAYSFVVAWLMPFLAAVWGAGAGMLPFAAGNARGTAFQEGVIAVGLTTVALTVIVLFALLLWGLRGAAPALSATTE